MNESEITSKVRHTIRAHDMITAGEGVLLCVSGGPDSVFLFHAFRIIGRELGLRLFVAHVEHGLRGQESKRDEIFVNELGKTYGIPVFSETLKLIKHKGLSTEECARKKRYDFFRRIAKKRRIKKIATGHTCDDQAETVLMRFIKGSSIKGLSGIPYVRREGAVTYIRPLLDVEKSEILFFLKKRKLKFRVDRTNTSGLYFRNVARNKILPFLRQFNPRIKRSLSNFAAQAGIERQYIDDAKRAFLPKVKRRKGKVYVSLDDITARPEAVQKEIVRDMLALSGGNIKKFTFRHWVNIVTMLRSPEGGKGLDLPGNVRMTKKGGMLQFMRVH